MFFHMFFLHLQAVLICLMLALAAVAATGYGEFEADMQVAGEFERFP